jgi:hypothetical protein
MSAVETELLHALRDVLAASNAVTAVLGDPVRIATASGERLAYPFIRFTAIDTAPNDSAEASGWVHQLSLEILARTDREEAQAALHAVRMALHAARPQLASFALSVLTVSSAALDRSDDPEIWRATLRLRVFTEPK